MSLLSARVKLGVSIVALSFAGAALAQAPAKPARIRGGGRRRCGCTRFGRHGTCLRQHDGPYQGDEQRDALHKNPQGIKYLVLLAISAHHRKNHHWLYAP